MTGYSRAAMPHLDGHLASVDPLSPAAAFTRLGPVSRRLATYDAVDQWEVETRRLPAPLQRLRRDARAFALRELRPLAQQTDLAAHAEPGQLSPALRDLIARAGRAGLLGDMLPMPLGSGRPARFRHPIVLQQCIRVEELARVCGGLMLLLSANALGAMPILLSGDPSAIRRFAMPLFRAQRRGEPRLFAFAITEPGAGSDAEEGHGARHYKPGVVARRDGDGWRLNGRKVFISGGDIADTLTVFAALEGEGMESWTCFIVRRGAPGFRAVRNELKMGMRASTASELEFDEVFVPDDHIIGGLRRGWALNRATLNLSRMPVGALAVGFAQGATDLAYDFACRMRLGGKPLIHFQEVQLQLAQMTAETSTARALIWQSADTWTPRQATASICKFQATDTAVRVAEMAMDLLGNHALLHANGAEKVFRDARLTQIFEGTNQINRLAVIEDFQDQLLARSTDGAAA
ncbi:MAG: acyl-CoA dehydrogenase family protein [Nevskiales bacterium]|nr:acyl-CoA dehydrogenase family protein [Nevskiales bacterium]